VKDIRYDAEGDILYVTFAGDEGQASTGVELTDNIVLYFNPETGRPLKLIIVSYMCLLEASAKAPVLLEKLTKQPSALREMVVRLLCTAPVSNFLRLVEFKPNLAGSVGRVFTPEVLKAVA